MKIVNKNSGKVLDIQNGTIYNWSKCMAICKK